MALYKRGDTYWYQFQFNGQRIQQSAQTGNKDAARQIEAAHRIRLAKGEAGIAERPPAPTLKEFAPRFQSSIETLCAEKPATVGFYKEKTRWLLDDRKLAGLRLNAIDEAVIDGYKQRRTRQASRYGRPLSPASVNRELATLRRLYPAVHAELGYIAIRVGKSKNAKRNLSLGARSRNAEGPQSGREISLGVPW